MNKPATGWLLLIAGLLLFVIEFVNNQPLSDVYNLITTASPLIIALAGLWLIFKNKHGQNSQ